METVAKIEQVALCSQYLYAHLISPTMIIFFNSQGLNPWTESFIFAQVPTIGSDFRPLRKVRKIARF